MKHRSIWLRAVAILVFLTISSYSNPASACMTPGVITTSSNYFGQRAVNLMFVFAEDCRDVVNIRWGSYGGSWNQAEFKPYSDEFGTCIPYTRVCQTNMTGRVGADPDKSYVFSVQSCRTRVLASSVCSNWSSITEYEVWSRLQLKHGGLFLDAEYCSNKMSLNSGSDYEGGACQLWRLVPTDGGWSRLQLKHGREYLDAAFCGNQISLNPGSDFEGGACQLWRLVPAEGGWSRLQLKHGEQFLDAAYCSTTMSLNSGSDFEGGACQLWRLVPSH